jgi:hypothetical protein
MALTKKAAREIIENGGSVLHKGKLITRVDQLNVFDGTAEEKEAERLALKARLAELEGEDAGDGQLSPDEKALAPAGGEGDEDTLDDSKEELMRHTRAELADMAGKKFIEIGENETKAQIIDKILSMPG